MTTTVKTFLRIDELDVGDVFSFPDCESRDLYVVARNEWVSGVWQPVRLHYHEIGSTDGIYRTHHEATELVECWTPHTEEDS